MPICREGRWRSGRLGAPGRAHATNLQSSWDLYLGPQAHMGPSPSLIRDQRSQASKAKETPTGSQGSHLPQRPGQGTDRELSPQPPSGPNRGNLCAAGWDRVFKASIQAAWVRKCLAFSGRVGDDGRRVRTRRLGGVYFMQHLGPASSTAQISRAAGWQAE